MKTHLSHSFFTSNQGNASASGCPSRGP